jgi:large subunit ribosomal protein L21
MYAIVKVGGKQYRVEKGGQLMVDRMREDEGATVALQPLLYAGDGKDDTVFSGGDLEKVKVEAKVVGHERGKKLRIVKFKPKRGYKRTTGHRSELTRLEISEIKLQSRKPAAKKADAKEPAAKKPAAKKPAAPKATAKKTAAPKKQKEAEDGS